MPKPAKGPRLGGSPANERKIIANLCKALIHNESVVTTEARARRVRPHIERLITKAKKGDTHNRRLALKVLNDRESAYILFEELAPQFAERQGGYTRITKLPHRKGDNAPMALVELVLEPVSPKQAVVKEAEKAAQKAAAVDEAAASEDGATSEDPAASENVADDAAVDSADSADSSESADSAESAESVDSADSAESADSAD